MLRPAWLIACCLWISATSLSAADAQLEAWKEKLPKTEKDRQILLFNGQDLTGWKGEEKYWSVSEGAIRGTNTGAVPSSTYLLTEKSFRNFRLLLEIRQMQGPDLSKKHSAVALLGEQIEDAGENRFGFKGPLVMLCDDWGLWDAHRRNRIIPKGRGPELEKQGEWNAVEILVIGNRIRCAVNGEVLFDFRDREGLLRESPIGLQLHRERRPQDYRFRGLMLVENPEDQLITASAAKEFFQFPEVAPSQLRDAAQGTEAATSQDPFLLLPGYKVEKLFTVPRNELGSWVNVAVDPHGRLIVSDQGNRGLCRITPPAPGSDDLVRVEHLDLDVSAAQGLLFAFDSLYVSSNGHGNGLHRIPYDTQTDTFGTPQKIADYRGFGEHGPHALRLSPDGKSIYVLAGNHTQPPFDREANEPPQTMGGARETILKARPPEGQWSRMPTNWDEDLLLRRMWDASGHARGILAPGGWVAKTDPEAKRWEIVSMGYRNSFDMDFNADGELFVYDADMEWDMGLPWYRPTRLLHAVSGSEFGWRSGSGKWPTYYPDSLPEVVNIGPGSPVGAEFGYGARVPAKYQQALYLCDWTFGTVYAVHLEPSGASYTGTKEEFLSRNALPLTDITTGADGAFYFTIGGRGIQSELFRVSYTGEESTEPAVATRAEGGDLRTLRHRLESSHSAPDHRDADADDWRMLVSERPLTEDREQYQTALKNLLIQQLAHADRHVRYAARVGLEFLPVDDWASDIFESADTQTRIEGSIAIARQGEAAHKLPLLEMLAEMDWGDMTEEQQLGYLRALQLAFIRLGAPSEPMRLAFLENLDRLYPGASLSLNRELVLLLVFLESPTVVEKTLELLQTPSGETESDLGSLLARNQSYGQTIRQILENQPDKQRIHYAYALRVAKIGWTPERWKTYFDFLELARTWKGANSYLKFVLNIDEEAFLALPEQQRLLLEAAGARKPFTMPELPAPAGPGRDYTLEEVRELARQGLSGGRNFKNGEKMYAATRCVLCHRFAGTGGSTGPDLTQLAGRFNIDALTEAILEPSKVVSDQYRAHNIITTEGRVHAGRIVSETPERMTVVIDPEDSTKIVELTPSEIEEMVPSQTSLMPDGLLKPLNENEVLDLLAYLLSRGNPNDRMFQPKK